MYKFHKWFSYKMLSKLILDYLLFHCSYYLDCYYNLLVVDFCQCKGPKSHPHKFEFHPYIYLVLLYLCNFDVLCSYIRILHLLFHYSYHLLHCRFLLLLDELMHCYHRSLCCLLYILMSKQKWFELLNLLRFHSRRCQHLCSKYKYEVYHGHNFHQLYHCSYHL